MELIFDEIIIIDELNKKAKKQVFLPGINIVVIIPDFLSQYFA